MSWQEQPSPNSKNDIRGLRLEKEGLANPLGDYGQGVRLLALTGARRSEVFGKIWQENRPLVEDLEVAGRRARRIITSIPLNEQAFDVRRGLCPAFKTWVSKTPVISLAEAGVARSRRKTQQKRAKFQGAIAKADKHMDFKQLVPSRFSL